MFEFNKGELISVVIPSYGHEKYILNALNSVYHQTYQNIELILLDDKSKDKTFEIAREWALQAKAKSRFSRIIIEKNLINQGAYNTINMAISMTNGKLIAILNSDDAYHPQRLELMSDALIYSSTGFAFSKVIPIDEDGNFSCTYHLPKGIADVFEFADRVVETMPSISFGFLQRNIAISTGNFLIHRELLNKIGNFRALLYVHDWDFALRVICECEPAYIPAPLYRYRIHLNNAFKSLAHISAIENEFILNSFKERLETGKYNNPDLFSPQNWPEVYSHLSQYMTVLRNYPIAG